MLAGLLMALAVQAGPAEPGPLPGEVQEPLTEEQIECELLPDWDAEICFDNDQAVEEPGLEVLPPPPPRPESCAMMAELRASWENGRRMLETLRRDLQERGIDTSPLDQAQFDPEAGRPPPPDSEATEENLAIYRYTTTLHMHRQTEFYLQYWQAVCGEPGN